MWELGELYDMCDPSARNESHVGSVQVEKICMIWANIIKFSFLAKFDALKPRIIILRPEMGSTPQY